MPKCKYCDNPADGGDICPDLCGTCLDVEHCYNVSKSEYGTRSMARFIARDHDMPEAYARLTGTSSFELEVPA